MIMQTCLNCGDWIVSFTSSSEFVRSPTSGRNWDKRFLTSGSANNGANDSVFIAVDRSTVTESKMDENTNAKLSLTN